MNSATAVLKSLVNLIYPLHCASCNRPLEAANRLGACDFCVNGIKRNPKPYCSRCGHSIERAPGICRQCEKMERHFECAYSACLYEGSMKELIHSFKYKNRRILSGLFAGLMLDFIKDNPRVTDSIEVITSVPIRSRRLSERGFNQSAVLAGCLSKECCVPTAVFLEKIRDTKNQNELTREERLMNVIGAFRVKKDQIENVKGSSILIIDDVMTTGSTLNEASRALIEAGARQVRCLTLARGA